MIVTYTSKYPEKADGYLLLETRSYLLLENGDKLLLGRGVVYISKYP